MGRGETYFAWSWTAPCTRSCDASSCASSGSSSTGRIFCRYPPRTDIERYLSKDYKFEKWLTSSSCMGSCCFRLDPEAKALPHLSQTNGRTPVCSLICLMRLLTYSNILVKYHNDVVASRPYLGETLAASLLLASVRSFLVMDTLMLLQAWVLHECLAAQWAIMSKVRNHSKMVSDIE
jgi:hypothetical protein